jgi:hypothetical protein
MGARKGQNNFADHQRKAVDGGALRMQRALKALPRGTRYADVNALIRAVADAAGIHTTTLRRNKRYLRLVWDHVTANPAIITQPLDETAPLAKLKVQAIAADIETAALRRENERLRRMVERLSTQPPAIAGPAPPPVAEPDGAVAAFERTATVLARVLDRFTAKELGIVLDLRRGEILDEAEAGEDRVIAGRPDTTPFLEWMRRQRGGVKPAELE